MAAVNSSCPCLHPSCLHPSCLHPSCSASPRVVDMDRDENENLVEKRTAVAVVSRPIFYQTTFNPSALVALGKYFSYEKAQPICDFLTIKATFFWAKCGKVAGRFIHICRSTRYPNGKKMIDAFGKVITSAPASFSFGHLKKASGELVSVVFISIKAGNPSRKGEPKKLKLAVKWTEGPTGMLEPVVRSRLVLKVNPHSCFHYDRIDGILEDHKKHLQLNGFSGKADYDVMLQKQRGPEIDIYTQFMEFFPEDVFEFLKKIRDEQMSDLSNADKILILREILSIYNRLHQLEYAHGDVKLENLLIHCTGTGEKASRSYKVRMCDLETVEKSTVPFESSEHRTLVYQPPNELSLSPHVTDRCKSDVFAVGLMCLRVYLKDWWPDWLEVSNEDEIIRQIRGREKYDDCFNLKVSNPHSNPLISLFSRMCNYNEYQRPSMDWVCHQFEIILAHHPKLTLNLLNDDSL